MSRDTTVIVRVPAEFQLSLGEYITLLERAGVKLSKSDAIIRLAQIGCHSELEQMKNNIGGDNG